MWSMLHRPRVTLVVMTLLLCLIITAHRGYPASASAECPPLVGQDRPAGISLHVAQVPDTAGVVCVWAINGLSKEITGIAGFMLRLQQWEKKWWWIKGQFRDFSETFPGGMLVGTTGVYMQVPAGGQMAQRLPLGLPAPPGRYRACLRYTLSRGEKEHKVCSEEFTLP